MTELLVCERLARTRASGQKLGDTTKPQQLLHAIMELWHFPLASSPALPFPPLSGTNRSPSSPQHTCDTCCLGSGSVVGLGFVCFPGSCQLPPVKGFPLLRLLLSEVLGGQRTHSHTEVATLKYVRDDSCCGRGVWRSGQKT